MSEANVIATLEPLAPVMDLITGESNLASLTNSVKVLLDQVKEILPKYSAANYSEDNIADAKADKATLNKFSKALNDKRIAYEKEYMKPLDEFKGTVTETTGLIKKTVDAIDTVVKAQEEKEKTERNEMINTLWRTLEFDIVPLSQVKKPEWMLKATSKKSIAADMGQIVNDIKADLGMLETMAAPEDWNAVKLFYLRDLDFKKATINAQQLKVQRETEAEKKRKAAESAIQPIIEPKDAKIAAEINSYAATGAPIPPAVITPSAPEFNPVSQTYVARYVRVFRVDGTREQIILLGNFMVANGIKFEKVQTP